MGAVKPRIITISGKMGHGKDTVGKLLADYWQERGEDVLITHYADLLKFICEKYFGWDGQKDEYGRALIQYVGTNIIRANRPKYWVGFIEDMLDFFAGEWDRVVIPDLRFPNELTELRSSGFPTVHLRVYRRAQDDELKKDSIALKHESENAMNDIEPDIWVYNHTTIDDLKNMIPEIDRQIEEFFSSDGTSKTYVHSKGSGVIGRLNANA